MPAGQRTRFSFGPVADDLQKVSRRPTGPCQTGHRKPVCKRWPRASSRSSAREGSRRVAAGRRSRRDGPVALRRAAGGRVAGVAARRPGAPARADSRGAHRLLRLRVLAGGPPRPVHRHQRMGSRARPVLVVPFRRIERAVRDADRRHRHAHRPIRPEVSRGSSARGPIPRLVVRLHGIDARASSSATTSSCSSSSGS